jgi:hypothetical protein
MVEIWKTSEARTGAAAVAKRTSASTRRVIGRMIVSSFGVGGRWMAAALTPERRG